MKPRTWADGNPTGALRRAYELMDELDAIESEKEKNSRGTIIYTKNNCQACKFTKLHMANMGVTYEERNVDDDDAYMQEAVDTGYKSMPIVVLNGKVVASGFQPDKLNELEVIECPMNKQSQN